MNFTNTNILSLSIFFGITLFFIFLMYLFFIKREKLKKKYFLIFNQNKGFYIKYIFLFFSLLIILFSVFNIKYLWKTEKQSINGIDIVFVLDISKSMNSIDFWEGNNLFSRLDFSKILISKYISNNPQNRYGLVVFAWEAMSLSPLTTDHSTFLTFLQNVSYKNLNIQWTNLEEAFKLWVQRLSKSNSEDDRSKALILLSDWADKDTIVDFKNISNTLKDKNIASLILWIWKKDWAKIPISQDFRWRITYQKYKWDFIITKLNSTLLSELANKINWDYLIIDNIDKLNKISSKIQKLSTKALEISWIQKQKDIWRFLAILSMILFILFLFYNKRIWD